MNFRIKYIGDSTWYDPKDYVVRFDSVPFISRNFDYSIDLDGLDVDFSTNYNFEGHSASSIEKIKIYDNHSNYFFGYNVKTHDARRKDVQKITFFKELYLLKNYLVYRDDIDAEIQSTSDTRLYNSSDINGGNSTSLMWLIKNMFEKAGLNDPTAHLSTKIAITNKTSYSNILFSELKVDMDIVYCINQNVAVNTNVSGKPTDFDYDLRITFFDFLDMFCKLFGVYLNTDSSGYYLDLADEETYGLVDAAILNYNKENFDKENKAVNFGFKFNSSRYNYRSNNTPTTITDGWYSNEDQTTTQNWYTNLIIGYEDRSNLGSIYELNSFVNYITAEDIGLYGIIGDKLRKDKDYSIETLTARESSIKYGNVMSVVSNIDNLTIKQVSF